MACVVCLGQVISEGAYINWQDDINDSTPGRDKVS